MSRILLIGGHGKVALLLEPLLVAAGHHVTAVVRNPAHEADIAAAGATDVDADTSLSVARADVAAVVVASADEPATSRRTVRFNTGDVPIAEALRGLAGARA